MRDLVVTENITLDSIIDARGAVVADTGGVVDHRASLAAHDDPLRAEERPAQGGRPRVAGLRVVGHEGQRVSR